MKKTLGFSIFLNFTLLLLSFTDILGTSKWVARILVVISIVNLIWLLKESKK